MTILLPFFLSLIFAVLAVRGFVSLVSSLILLKRFCSIENPLPFLSVDITFTIDVRHPLFLETGLLEDVTRALCGCLARLIDSNPLSVTIQQLEL